MDKLCSFFRGYLDIINASDLTKKRTFYLVNLLRTCDPFNKTKFEASFKLSRNRILPCVRFTNLDVNGYAHINSSLFLSRLKIYKEIIKECVPVGNVDSVFRALMKLSDNPLDLYFGADIQNKYSLFNIWLKFGNMRRNGDIQFWADGHEITRHILKSIGFARPEYMETSGINNPIASNRELLFVGLDLENTDMAFKLHYVVKNKETLSNRFASITRYVNSNLSWLRYGYAYVYKFNRKGSCINERLCLELQDSIYIHKKCLKKMFFALSPVLDHDPNKLMKLFKADNMPEGVRLSIISFEPDGTPTFYLILD